MLDGAVETVTIAEAAALLGVHRNTVRNRIKAGRYKAHKLITAQGETFAIERDSLGLPPANAPHNASHAQGPHNAPRAAQPGGQDAGLVEAQQLAVVQRLLAPFVTELAATNAELGRVQERLAATERERDGLRVEVDRLRAAQDAATARDVGPGGAEAAEAASTTSPPLWDRIRALFGR